jgi:hypothetical protein
MICRRCEVGWAGAKGGPFCWVCGDEGSFGTVEDLLARPAWFGFSQAQWSYVAEEARRLELGEVA